MATRNFNKRPSGSYKPKAVGAILDEMLRSDSNFAVAFRNHFPDTHLCVDVKVFSIKPGRMPVGAYLVGSLTRDGEDHFRFVENEVEKKVKTFQRTPVIFAGNYVNVHLLADGNKRLEFNRPRLYPGFSFRDFCLASAQELLTIARLFGEEDAEE